MGGGTTVLIQTIDGRPNDNNVDVNSIQVPYRTPSRAVELHSPSSPSSSNTPAPPFATVRLRSTKATSDLKSAASSWLEVTNRASSNASPLSAPSIGKERSENADGRLGLDLLDSSTSTSRDKPTKLPNGLPSRTTSPTSPEDHVRTEHTSRLPTSTFTHMHKSPNSLHPGVTSSNLSPSERKERRKRRRERLDRPLPPPPDVGLEDEKAERKNENDSLVSDAGPSNLKRAVTNPCPGSSTSNDHQDKRRAKSKYLPRDIYSNLHRLAEHELLRCGDPRSLSLVDPLLVDVPVRIGIVLSIVQSRRYRDRLEHMINCLDAANPPKVSEAIARDEPKVEKLLIEVLNSDSEKKIAFHLRSHDAELFMDVLQDFERNHNTDQPDLARNTRNLLIALSKRNTSLPEYMFISGVAPVKERNIFGGTYGDVYRSTFEGKPVALKRLRIFQRSDDDERRSLYKKFCNEALMWQTLRHEFVLPFLGIDAENFPRQPCMVSPWMSNGTLIHFLKRNPKANVDKLLFEIAQGIDYLHSQNIVHGDIKGVNILIDEHWKPLLADFGLTLFADATRHNTTGQGGTLRWMAPELFAGYDDSTPSKRTFASDIYAYGCLCVEAYTRKIPFYHEVRNEFGIIGFAKGGGRPSRPTESSAMTDELWELVNACWHQNPSSRPKSAMVVAVLRTILRKSATDNSQQLRSTLSKISFASSMSGGVSLHSNLNNPITSGTGEESVKKTMSSEDHAELARCRKRIRRHADPNRMYQDVKILRYSSSIKISEAAIKGTNTTVYIKKFRTSSQDVDTLRRLVDEFHDMRFLHHVNLINYFDLFQHDHDIWVVLESIHKSVSLKQVISANVNKDAGLKESFITTVLRNVGQAVHYLHRHGLVHENINSEEVLLSYVGNSVLVKLRMGAMLKDPESPRVERCYTAGTDPSEERSTAFDVWSLGLLAIEMFDSAIDVNLPCSKLLEQVKNSSPPPSTLLLDFLERTLQPDPEKRPSIASLLQDHFLQK